MRKRLPPPGSRAYGLARYSSDLQNPKSADDQLREIVEYCHTNGWTVVGQEKDEGRTGRTTVGRTGFEKAMAAAQAGECDIIVVEDISRFARNAADTLVAAQKLDEVNVALCTVGGGVLSGLELVIRAQWAQEQSEEIGRRVKRGHRSAALRGRAIGGVAYGYRIIEHQGELSGNREIDEREMKVVLRIYQDLAAGVSAVAICKALNREGVPGPGGKLWRSKAITGERTLMTGIGRNPIYIGKLIYGKTNSRLITSSGKKEVSAGDKSDQVVSDAPHLRVMPDELWLAVQDLLEVNGAQLLNSNGIAVPNRVRKPTHVLSGLTKCGCCGQSYSMIGERMGCEGRRQGVCENGRRVSRLDVQDAVLSGLKERLLQPQLLQFYLDEYHVEIEKARAEQTDRIETVEDRLREVDRQIASVMTVAKAGTAHGLAAELLNGELVQLAAQRRQLELERRRAPIGPTLSLNTDAVIERLGVLADDLGEGLKGPERDAARARDIVRSFITKVIITPMESSGKQDGRGAGPVRVTTEGSLAKLLGLAVFDREILRRESALMALDLSTISFCYYIDLENRDPTTLSTTFSDAVLFGHMLSDADVPVRKRELVEALKLNDSGEETKPSPDFRARYVIDRLSKAGLIRSVRVSSGYSGWVRNDRDLDDTEWKRRGMAPPPGAPSTVTRVSAPEPFVVVVGPTPVSNSAAADQSSACCHQSVEHTRPLVDFQGHGEQ